MGAEASSCEAHGTRRTTELTSKLQQRSSQHRARDIANHRQHRPHRQCAELPRRPISPVKASNRSDTPHSQIDKLDISHGGLTFDAGTPTRLHSIQHPPLLRPATLPQHAPRCRLLPRPRIHLLRRRRKTHKRPRSTANARPPLHRARTLGRPPPPRGRTPRRALRRRRGRPRDRRRGHRLYREPKRRSRSRLEVEAQRGKGLPPTCGTPVREYRHCADPAKAAEEYLIARNKPCLGAGHTAAVSSGQRRRRHLAQPAAIPTPRALPDTADSPRLPLLLLLLKANHKPAEPPPTRRPHAPATPQARIHHPTPLHPRLRPRPHPHLLHRRALLKILHLPQHPRLAHRLPLRRLPRLRRTPTHRRPRLPRARRRRAHAPPARLDRRPRWRCRWCWWRRPRRRRRELLCRPCVGRHAQLRGCGAARRHRAQDEGGAAAGEHGAAPDDRPHEPHDAELAAQDEGERVCA